MPNFTDRFLKSLKPRNKKYIVSEGRGGFIVTVYTTGSISFTYRYTINKRERRINLGIYGTITLAQARVEYGELYKRVQAGEDPAEIAKAVPTTFPAVAAPESTAVISEDGVPATIAELAYTFLEKWSKRYHSAEWYGTNKSALNKHLVPTHGHMDPKDFKPRHAHKLIAAVAKESPGASRNLIKAARRMFGYALIHEWVDFNPFLGGFASYVPEVVQVSRDRYLSQTEIPAAWKRICYGPGSDAVRKALLLTLVTAQRPGEVATIEAIDIDGDWWIIPPEKIKTEKKKGMKRQPRPHLVYLTPLAKVIMGDPKSWLSGVAFPTARSGNVRKGAIKKAIPIKESAMNKLVRKEVAHKDKGIVKEEYYGMPRWTPHDLRRTASTMMNSLGISERHVDMVLNHALPVVEGTYNLYGYAEEKKQALLKWEEKLKELLGDLPVR
ncbi:site-specific integrase, partial [Geobacter sp. SVR]